MAEPPTAGAARRLIRRTRAGVLATTTGGKGPESGTAFASLVTPATAPDLSPILLLSGLARHTRNLAADARCSLLLAGPALGPNPQTAPRVTLIGNAAPVPDASALKARWVALHPYAASYAELPDFRLWRLTIAAAHFVAGFAATARIPPAELLPDPDSVAAVAAAEAGILAHCNADHAEAMSAIAKAAGGAGEGWRVVAVDVDGCDLALSETVVRVEFAAPVQSPGDVRAELVRLARAARETLPPAGPGAG
jgi:putative heme iron utilization protein